MLRKMMYRKIAVASSLLLVILMLFTTSCKALDFINDLFDVIKIACTALCIFLCISDVYKMIVTNENSIDKFKSSLIKRIVALVAVFLLPLFINIITDLINDRYLKSNPSKCSNIIRK